MHNYASLFWTSVGRKFFTALFGILLMGFVVGHLAGNVTLILGAEALNGYAEFLEDLAHGLFLPLAEFALVAMFGVHVASALLVWLQNRSTRRVPYVRQRNAGGASRKTLSSTSMLVTGLILLTFVVIHVATFRLGIGMQTHYYGGPGEHQVRNLYRLVVGVFHNPLWVGFYCAVMVLLGLHLRHGIWSAFQTLGILSPGLRRFLYALGVVGGIALALGFLLLPLYVHFFIDPNSQSVVAPGGIHP